MKPFTPKDAEHYTHENFHQEIVLLAYKELIAEHLNKPIKSWAKFTQAHLIGRIHLRGLQIDGMHLIEGNYLCQEQLFEEWGWIVEPDHGFYYICNGSLTITFKSKEHEDKIKSGWSDHRRELSTHPG